MRVAALVRVSVTRRRYLVCTYRSSLIVRLLSVLMTCSIPACAILMLLAWSFRRKLTSASRRLLRTVGVPCSNAS